MKKGEPIKVGWKDIIKPLPFVKDVVGYSLPEDIAKKTNVSFSHAHRVLKRAYLNGETEAIQARRGNGRITWMYKD